MVMIPKRNELEAIIESKTIPQTNRPYIGASGLGSKCQRKIWLDFRWVYQREISARLARIFERGDLEENRIIKDLKEAGVIIESTQTGFTDDTGHIKGHVDGIISNLPGDDRKHLLEIKTMNDARFKAYIKDGLKSTNFTYYVQMNLYMGFLNLERCLFITTNKNDESRLYKFYDFDEAVFSEYKNVGFQILTSEQMPPAIGGKTWFECKMCDAKSYCHGDEPTAMNCRTCTYADIEMNGVWNCSKNHIQLSVEDQRMGCDKYEKSEVYK